MARQTRPSVSTSADHRECKTRNRSQLQDRALQPLLNLKILRNRRHAQPRAPYHGRRLRLTLTEVERRLNQLPVFLICHYRNPVSQRLEVLMKPEVASRPRK